MARLMSLQGSYLLGHGVLLPALTNQFLYLYSQFRISRHPVSLREIANDSAQPGVLRSLVDRIRVAEVAEV